MNKTNHVLDKYFLDYYSAIKNYYFFSNCQNSQNITCLHNIPFSPNPQTFMRKKYCFLNYTFVTFSESFSFALQNYSSTIQKSMLLLAWIIHTHVILIKIEGSVKKNKKNCFFHFCQ